MRYKLFAIYGSLVTLAACTSFAILKLSQAPEALSLTQCQLVELRPDPTDCSKFYNCHPNGTKLFQCSAGFHFNPTKLVCELADQTRCTTNDEENSTTLSIETSYTDEFTADFTVVSVVEFETARDYYTTDNALDESSRDGTSETPVITVLLDDVEPVTQRILLNITSITSNYEEISTNEMNNNLILSPINNLTISGHEILTGTSSEFTKLHFINSKYSSSEKSSSEYDISSSYKIKMDTNDPTKYIINIIATEPTKDYTHEYVIENSQFSSDVTQLEQQENVDDIELCIELSSNGNINSQPTEQITSIPFNGLTDERNSSKNNDYRDLNSLEENGENIVGFSTYNPKNYQRTSKLDTNIEIGLSSTREYAHPTAYDRQKDNEYTTIEFTESQPSTATSENTVNAMKEIVENDTEYPIYTSKSDDEKVKSGLTTNFGLDETELDNVDTDNIKLYTKSSPEYLETQVISTKIPTNTNNDENIHHQYSEIDIATISSLIEGDSKLVPTDYDNISEIHVSSTVRHFDTNPSAETFEEITDSANYEYSYISSNASISSETSYPFNDSYFHDMKSNFTNNYSSDSDKIYINNNHLSTDLVKQQNQFDRSTNITENISEPTGPSDINDVEHTYDLSYTSLFVDQELVKTNSSSSIQEITTDFFENEDTVILSTKAEESGEVSRGTENIYLTTKFLVISNTNFSVEGAINTSTENIMPSTIISYSQLANDENFNKTLLSTDLLKSEKKRYATTIGAFLYLNQGFTPTSNISVTVKSISPIIEDNETISKVAKQSKTSTDSTREGLKKTTKQSSEILKLLKYEDVHTSSYSFNKSSTHITITNLLQISSNLYSSFNSKTKNIYSEHYENYEDHDATETKGSNKDKIPRNRFGIDNNVVNYGDDTIKNDNTVEDDENIDSYTENNANDYTLEDRKSRDNLKEVNKNEDNRKTYDTNEANVKDENNLYEDNIKIDDTNENNMKVDNTEENNNEFDNTRENNTKKDSSEEDNKKEDNENEDYTADENTEEDITYEDNTEESSDDGTDKNSKYNIDDDTHEKTVEDLDNNDRSGEENTNEETARYLINRDNSNEDISIESDDSKDYIFNDTNDYIDENADSKDHFNKDNTKKGDTNIAKANIFQNNGNRSEYNDKVNEQEYHLRRLLEANKSVSERNNGRNHNHGNRRKQLNNRSYRKNKSKDNDSNRNKKVSQGLKMERRNQQNSHRYEPNSKEDIVVTRGNRNLKNNQNRNKGKSSSSYRKWRTLNDNENSKEGNKKRKERHAFILNIKKVIFEKSLKDINWEL